MKAIVISIVISIMATSVFAEEFRIRKTVGHLTVQLESTENPFKRFMYRLPGVTGDDRIIGMKVEAKYDYYSTVLIAWDLDLPIEQVKFRHGFNEVATLETMTPKALARTYLGMKRSGCRNNTECRAFEWLTEYYGE